jgi:hypothetical protein
MDEIQIEEWERLYDENMKTYVVDVKKEVFYKKNQLVTKHLIEPPIEKIEELRKEYIRFISHFSNDNTSRGY